jgi:hypothetical protein
MLSLHITHVKRDGSDPGHVMDFYCGPGWAMEAELAFRHYRSGQKFHAYEGGKRADVTLEKSITGRPYFRTVSDSSVANNLSALPPPALSPLARAILASSRKSQAPTILGATNAFSPPPKRTRTLLG